MAHVGRGQDYCAVTASAVFLDSSCRLGAAGGKSGRVGELGGRSEQPLHLLTGETMLSPEEAERGRGHWLSARGDA